MARTTLIDASPFGERRRSTGSPLRHVAAALTIAVLLAGCGNRPAGGDPGGRRLHELSTDAVFASHPDGATAIRLTRTPASYRAPGFTGGGWRGPAVAVTFRSSAPPADVYGFYARRAAASGWRATGANVRGQTDRWAKTYPDGAAATLLLATLTPSPAGSERHYALNGGVAPVES